MIGHEIGHYWPSQVLLHNTAERLQSSLFFQTEKTNLGVWKYFQSQKATVAQKAKRLMLKYVPSWLYKANIEPIYFARYYIWQNKLENTKASNNVYSAFRSMTDIKIINVILNQKIL